MQASLRSFGRSHGSASVSSGEGRAKRPRFVDGPAVDDAEKAAGLVRAAAVDGASDAVAGAVLRQRIGERALLGMGWRHFLRMGVGSRVAVRQLWRALAPQDRGRGRVPVAVIGTAGRRAAEVSQLSEVAFGRMVAKCREIIEQVWGLRPSEVQLVSGGAAWSDHVAVHLFLHHAGYDSLHLHMPCPFGADGRFAAGASSDASVPRSANRYHATFSSRVARDSLAELQQAVAEGAAVTDSYDGFQHRNAAVAKAGRVIAFTMAASDDAELPRGGTAHTWRMAAKTGACRVHVSIPGLLQAQ